MKKFNINYYKDVEIPFANLRYTALYYDKYIYINTNESIYQYDINNKIFNKIIIKPITSSYAAFQKDEMMYIINWRYVDSAEISVGSFNMKTHEYNSIISNRLKTITHPGQDSVITTFTWQDGYIYLTSYGFAGAGRGWKPAYNLYTFNVDDKQISYVKGSEISWTRYGANPTITIKDKSTDVYYNYWFSGQATYANYSDEVLSTTLRYGIIGNTTNLNSYSFLGTPDDYYMTGFYLESENVMYLFGTKNISKYDYLNDKFTLINENSEFIYGNMVEADGLYYAFGSTTIFIAGIHDTISTGFYQNTSTFNRIDKTDYLTKVRDIEGTFRSDVDVSHPVMRYQSEEMPDFNYAIIGELNSRCYYIDKVTYIAKGLWQLDMSIDVLMTYKDAIMNLKTFVTRNQYDYNTLIPDDRLPLQQGREITYEIIPNDLFGNSGSFLLQGLLLTPGKKIKEDPTTDDLLGTWVLRDKPNLIVDINNKSIPITFTSDEDTYLYFSVYDYRLIRYINNEFTNDIYNEDHYIDDVYKTITITSADISNSLVKMLYYWLTNNATKQEA